MKKTQRGFALLVAIIFMSVMLSFGLALGSIGYKQQVLASSAIESQYAFYAADAALECALYADQGAEQNIFAYPSTDPSLDPSFSVPSMKCDGAAPFYTPTFSYTPGVRWIVDTLVPLDVSTAHPRCAKVSVYKPAPDSGGPTYIFSQGYDVSCGTVNDPKGARFVSRGLNAHY